MALTLISSIANKDLANELLPTVTDLFQSNNCYIKVRAIICATVLVHYLPEVYLCLGSKKDQLYQSIYVSFRDLIKDDEPQIIHTTLSISFISTVQEKVSFTVMSCVSSSPDTLPIVKIFSPYSYKSSLITQMCPVQSKYDTSSIPHQCQVMKLFSLLLPQEQRLVVKIMKPLIEMTEITENTSILYTLSSTIHLIDMSHYHYSLNVWPSFKTMLLQRIRFPVMSRFLLLLHPN